MKEFQIKSATVKFLKGEWDSSKFFHSEDRRTIFWMLPLTMQTGIRIYTLLQKMKCYNGLT